MTLPTGPVRAALTVLALAALAGAGSLAHPAPDAADAGEASVSDSPSPSFAGAVPHEPSDAVLATAAGSEAPRSPGGSPLAGAGPGGAGLVIGADPEQRAGTRPDGYYDFHFTRAVYSTGGRGWGRRSWAIDYPKADRQFLIVLAETLDLLHVPREENAIRLDDPELRRFPFLYMLEVGYMHMTEDEVQGLREYLEAGGFLVVDDFWGDYEWRNFEREMRRVFPDRQIEDLPMDHPIFHTFYEIDELLQVPSVGNARRGRTSECGACRPQARGIFDDEDRLMVVINWNTDLGDAWEWSERPEYPFQYSNFAYKMAVNFIIYAMTR